jgi:hypothetical protein
MLGVGQPHDQHARVRARREAASIGEVQVLGDEETLFRLSGGPHMPRLRPRSARAWSDYEDAGELSVTLDNTARPTPSR